MFFFVLLSFVFAIVQANSGPDLLALLNNKDDITTNLTRKALRNLVHQANDLIENLTMIQNQSSNVYKELQKINDVLSTSKQSDLPKTINKNQLGDALSSLLHNNEQTKIAGNKFGGFLQNLRDFQQIFNDPHGLEKAFGSILLNSLLKSNAKKLQDQYGLSNTFFDDIFSIFQSKSDFKDVIYKLLNPCEKRNCDALQNGVTQLKKLVKLSDTPTLADILDKSDIFHNLFNQTSNYTVVNITSVATTRKDVNESNSVSGPSLLDKIVSFFNNPKAAIGKILAPPTTTMAPPPHPASKLGSLADLLNTLFKPEKKTSGEGSSGENKHFEEYYDTLYGNKP